MKKTIFFAALSLLTIFSCKNDDEEEVGSRTDIVGVWKLKEKTVISGKNGLVLHTMNVTTCDGNNTYEYSADKKYKATYYSDASGDCLAVEEVAAKYNYNPEYHRVTVTFNNGTSEVTNVRELSGNVMKLEGAPTDYDSDGINDIIVNVYNK